MLFEQGVFVLRFFVASQAVLLRKRHPSIPRETLISSRTAFSLAISAPSQL